MVGHLLPISTSSALIATITTGPTPATATTVAFATATTATTVATKRAVVALPGCKHRPVRGGSDYQLRVLLQLCGGGCVRRNQYCLRLLRR